MAKAKRGTTKKKVQDLKVKGIGAKSGAQIRGGASRPTHALGNFPIGLG